MAVKTFLFQSRYGKSFCLKAAPGILIKGLRGSMG